MPGPCLPLLIAALLALPADDPAGLVAGLGAASPADRERAVRDLVALGRAALPPLEAACRSADPEVRSRALAAWEATQRPLLRQPTLVGAPGGRLTPADLTRWAREQGGMTIETPPPGPDAAAGIAPDGPLPFWEAVERVRLGGPRLDQRATEGETSPVLVFQAQAKAYPTATSGPFRITLERLHERRDATLIAGPWVRLDSFEQRVGIPRGVAPRDENLHADLRVLVEPRAWFMQENPVRVIEAVDDLGQSLVPPPGSKDEADQAPGHLGDGVADLRVRLDLALAPRAGSRLVRLRGEIPVALLVRRPVPELDLVIAEAIGKPSTIPLGTFTLSRNGDFGRDACWVDVRLDPLGNDLPAGTRSALFSARLACLFRHQFDFVDARGAVVGGVMGAGGWGQDGVGRMNYTFGRQGSGGRPVRLRIYQLLREPAVVAFEFRDVPLP